MTAEDDKWPIDYLREALDSPETPLENRLTELLDTTPATEDSETPTPTDTPAPARPTG